MEPRITILTITVDDLDRALRFYRDGLGFQTPGIVGDEYEYGAVAFFELQPGLQLALWPRSSISRDTGLPQSPPAPTEFSLGQNVSSREEVDAVIAQVERAGATIVQRPRETFYGGYSGYFMDPDHHLWEVIFFPEQPA